MFSGSTVLSLKARMKQAGVLASAAVLAEAYEQKLAREKTATAAQSSEKAQPISKIGATKKRQQKTPKATEPVDEQMPLPEVAKEEVLVLDAPDEGQATVSNSDEAEATVQEKSLETTRRRRKRKKNKAVKEIETAAKPANEKEVLSQSSEVHAWWTWWITSEEILLLIESSLEKSFKIPLRKLRQIPGGGYIIGDIQPLTRFHGNPAGCHGYAITHERKTALENSRTIGFFTPYKKP